MTDLIRAPWTSEQVSALEQFQTASGMHPFTFGAVRHALRPRLVPSRSGWYCPDPDCDYRQDWAHAFMANPNAWPQPFADLRRQETEPEQCPADWDAAGCARDCSEQHTYAWGRCALAPESARPEPTISIGRVETEADGQPGIVLRSIPLPAWEALITVAKWVSRGKTMALDADPAIAPAYPDAAARRALGALDDAGLLDHSDPRLAALQAATRAEGTGTATWTAVRAIQLMNEAGRQRDEARAALERVRELADDAEYGTYTVDVDTLRSVLPEAPADTLPGTAKEKP